MCSSAGRRKLGPGEAVGSMTGVGVGRSTPGSPGGSGGGPDTRSPVSGVTCGVFGSVFVFAPCSSRASPLGGESERGGP